MHRWVLDHFYKVGFQFVVRVLFGSLPARIRRCWKLLLHYFLTSSPDRPIVASKIWCAFVSVLYGLPVSLFCKGGFARCFRSLKSFYFPFCEDIQFFSHGFAYRFRQTCSVFILSLVCFSSIQSYVALGLVFFVSKLFVAVRSSLVC